MILATLLSWSPVRCGANRCPLTKGSLPSSGGNYDQVGTMGSRNRTRCNREWQSSGFRQGPRGITLLGKSNAPLRDDGKYETASDQARTDMASQTPNDGHSKNPTFRRRVEEAAATLRLGTSSQQRRKTSTSTDSFVVFSKGSTEISQQTTRQSPGTAASQRSSKQGIKTSSSSSILSSSESNDQMAASQRRLFEQMVTLRTRLNERLAASNKFAKYLESTLKTRDKDIKHANERLVAAMLEIESLKHIAKEAVEAFESEEKSRIQIAGRLDNLTKRLDLMHAALRRDVKDIDAACIKSVPIRWVGMASDIRIMGSFDHWTKGVAMSPEFIEGGNNVFVADLMLVSGTYEIKFVVDGIWQTAPEWATTGDGLGANNILVVE